MSFEETGLAQPLADAAASLGYEAPTPLQSAALPIVRRGGNLAIRGASGAGTTFAWGAGLLERLAAIETGDDPLALVLTPTEERAGRVADALARLAAAVPAEGIGERIRSLRIRARRSGWKPGPADILVAPLDSAANALSASAVKLGNVAILVVDGLDVMLALEHATTLETVVASVPREAQRILVSAEYGREADQFAAAHARRAMRVPPRAATEARGEAGRSIAYRITPEASKLDRLSVELVRRKSQGEVILVRSANRTRLLREALERRGFQVGEQLRIEPFGAAGGTIALDVPFDAATLAAMDAGEALVLITPDELAHLRTIAAEAGVELQPSSGERIPRGSIDVYRRHVERALEEEDLDAQLALLAPLLERRGAEEVAAALSAMLRRRAPAAEAPAVEAAPQAAPAFVRLFVSAGQKDRLRPADLVGAITGESGIPGDKVGRIEIRDTFSVVEVAADAADRVIRALNGTTLRGRSLRVDYDRRASPGAVRRARPPRPGS